MENRKDNNSSLHSLKFEGNLNQIRHIARGGMSEIYRANQPSLNRNVVVKRLREELKATPNIVERFRREAKALASVLHQNVAHVYDFVESGGESYIIMEYIDGIDLTTVIEKASPVPPNVAAAILLGVAKGVSYIHAHNLIHRDIKPANIRLTTRGEVKLMDFGIVMDTGAESLTRPGVMVGSPNYLSPEQVLGDPISPKADVFLMGIVLYEMLTGVRPFNDDAKGTVFNHIRESNFIPIEKMRSAIPKPLASMVNRCLQKDPHLRFGSVKELIRALEDYLGPQVSNHTEDIILKFLDAEALLNPSISFSDLPTSGKKFSWAAAAVALLLAGGSLLAGYQLGRRQAFDKPVAVELKYKAPKAIKKFR